MTNIKQIEYVVNETFGPEAIPIVEYLRGKKNISEFVIAKDISIEIHRIRQILYKLFEENIVIFMRKKDKEKGWYICYWSLNEAEIPHIQVKIKKRKIQKLKERMEQESANKFYMCRNACTRINFDSAFEMNFKCPDCGEIMNEQDNERTLKFLTERIAELEKEIEEDMKKIMHTKEVLLVKKLADNAEEKIAKDTLKAEKAAKTREATKAKKAAKAKETAKAKKATKTKKEKTYSKTKSKK